MSMTNAWSADVAYQRLMEDGFDDEAARVMVKAMLEHQRSLGAIERRPNARQDDA